ncbi:c-type cytochrome [Frateuria aurantia]
MSKSVRSLAMLTGFAWIAAAHAVDADDSVAKGAYLAKVADCVACHTAKGGQEFAGGLPMATPIGTIYSTNITPDKQHGIGSFSYEDFERAVRQGIRKDGSTLYPAMPYPSYASVSDEDMHALYAYFMHGVQPVAQANRDTDIPWPLSMRWPLTLWRKLFSPAVGVPQAPAGASAQVARGAYLVEGLGHCGACHTPRAITMQEKAMTAADGSAFLAGSTQPIDGWIATSLRGEQREGLGRWSQEQIKAFLQTGRNDHSAVFGGMSDVVKHSSQAMSDADLDAISAYLKTLPPANPADAAFVPDAAAGKALWGGDDHAVGAATYIDSCAACHRTDGTGYQRVFPALGGNPVVMGADPASLIRIVLTGGTLGATSRAPSTFTMPAFGWRLNDAEVAAVVSFIRGSWGNHAGPVDAAQVAKVRKTLTTAQMVIAPPKTNAG